MPTNTRYRYRGSLLLPSVTPGVKWLLIANIGIWALDLICGLSGYDGIFSPFRLTPLDVVRRLEIWQLVTYMFLHSVTSPMHILFNMLALWMFGSEIERTWGTREFLKFYFVCGIGAGVCVVIIALLFGQGAISTIGASGAIYGLLLAFGLLFPDTTVLLIIFPIKAKYLVIIMGALALYFSVSGGNSGVSNVAHLGGLVVGFVYMKLPHTRMPALNLGRRYEQWKLQRARRKFQVYMRKQDSKREPWVH
jgi:membrane associated rhomboid family serine protease